MRILLLVLVFCGMPLCPSPAGAAVSLLVDSEIASAVSVPGQTESEGFVDVLFELRAERGNATLLVLTHFPQGLGKETDMALARYARDMHGNGFVDVQERSEHIVAAYLADVGQAKKSLLPLERAIRDWGNTFTAVATWQAFQPSPEYVTVLFRQDMSGGGAHASWLYSAVTYDLQTGKPVTVNDVFPGIENPLGPLETRILASLKKSAPALELTADDLDLKMERMVLTSEGLRVVFAPYEIGSFSDGEFMVDIPKRELLSSGARPEIWAER